MPVPHQEPDRILELVNSKAASAGATEQPIPSPPIPTAAPAPGDAQPVSRDPDEEKDARLVTELADHFKKPQELMRRIVAAATRLAQPEFPTRNDILAIIAVESSFDPRASDRRGSRGLMQINLAAHRDKLPGKNPYDVDDNVGLGVAILGDYYVQLGKKRRAAILAYNAGIGNYLKRRYIEKYYRKYLEYLEFMSSITR